MLTVPRILDRNVDAKSSTFNENVLLKCVQDVKEKTYDSIVMFWQAVQAMYKLSQSLNINKWNWEIAPYLYMTVLHLHVECFCGAG
jgi:hypothetical protein